MTELWSKIYLSVKGYYVELGQTEVSMTVLDFTETYSELPLKSLYQAHTFLTKGSRYGDEVTPLKPGKTSSSHKGSVKKQTHERKNKNVRQFGSASTVHYSNNFSFKLKMWYLMVRRYFFLLYYWKCCWAYLDLR